MISTTVLTIILVATIAYFIYVKYNSTNEMFESEKQAVSEPISIYEQPKNSPEDSSCTFPKIKYPPKAEFRTCQVYLTNNKAACDIAKAADPLNTCKYEFNGWHEFDTTKDASNNKKEYEFKEYTRDRTKPIINDLLVNKCFKEFQHNSFPMPFEYENNSLINHDCTGETSDTDRDTNKFNNMKYTSFNFLNSANAGDNYNNLLNSICSVKYEPIPALQNKSFFKFVINPNRTIDNIEKYTLNSTQTDFLKDTSFTISNFTSSSAYGMAYDVSRPGKNFVIFNISTFQPKTVNVYKFVYNYLCQDKQIMSFDKISTKLMIDQLLDVQSSRSSYTKIDIDKVALDWNRYATSANYIDQKPVIIADLNNMLTNINNDIDNRFNQDITNQNNIVTAQAKKIEDGNIEYSQYNPTFNQVIGFRNFNIQAGAVINKKTLNYDNINFYAETVVKKDQSNNIGITPIKIKNTDSYYYELKDVNFTHEIQIPNNTTCDIFMIGGGGGGGANHAGGGGAGAYYYATNYSLNAGTYTVKVGAGGRGQLWNTTSAALNGEDTYIQLNGVDVLRCKGGGRGGYYSANRSDYNGGNGGCGGGGLGWDVVYEGARIYAGGATNNTGTVGQGNAGGSGYNDFGAGILSGGGGGGIGGAGENVSTMQKEGGKGGNGLVFDIKGIEEVYGGGGGGGEWPVYARSPAGKGGGATVNGNDVIVGGNAGYSGNSVGTNGVTNTGSGGGSGKAAAGGSGGSGVVIIRFKRTGNLTNLLFNNLSFYENKTNLVCWHKMENADSMLSDSSGNNNNLSHNGATYDSNVYAKGYGSIKLSGDNQYLNISPNINPYNICQSGTGSNAGITFSIWFKGSPSSGNWCRIMDFGDNAEGIYPSNTLLIAKEGNSNKLRFQINNATFSDATFYSTPENYFDNTWHHIVWSISKTNKWTIYIDTVLKYSSAFSTIINSDRAIQNANWQRRYIGRSCYSVDGWFNGNVDDFRIYNKVLSHVEVSVLYMYDDYNRANTNIYSLTSSSQNFIVSQQYTDANYVFSTVLNAKQIFTYNVYGNLYLQKGYYIIYAYLSQSSVNQFDGVYELCILDENNTLRVVSCMKPSDSNADKYDIYITSKPISLENGGFYKIMFRSIGINLKATVTTEFKINVSYIYHYTDSIKLNSLLTSFVNATEVQINANYRTVSVNISSLPNGNEYVNNSGNENIREMDTTNYARYLYYGFSHTDDIKKIFTNIYNTLPSLSDFSSLKMYLGNSVNDYFGINAATRIQTIASTRKGILENIRDALKGNIAPYTVENQIIVGQTIYNTNEVIYVNSGIQNIKDVIKSIENLNYTDILGNIPPPKLKSGVNIFSIFDKTFGAIDENRLTVERFPREQLRGDGSIPATAARSLYIEAFV